MTTNNRSALQKVSESRLQSNCYQWAYNTYPQVRGLFFSVPNGGTRNVREAQTLKATGLTPGIPDMILLSNATVYGFEFKSLTGRVSPTQIRIFDIWKEKGIYIHYINNEAIFKIIFDTIISAQ